MDYSRVICESIKIWLLFGGIILALSWTTLPKKWAARALIVLTVLATINYNRAGFKSITKRIDNYDLIHYYINSKYFSELGYFDLYPAAMVVNEDNPDSRFNNGSQYMAQNAAGHGFMPIRHALARGKQVRKEKFTPERWASFEHDFLVLQRDYKGFEGWWRTMIQDHGFNGTPAWAMFARVFSSWVPIEWVKVLCLMDLGLLIAATGMVAWAYGSNTAMWAWFFLMTSYSLRWPTISWAFLRYDYVAALMMATALIKGGRPFWGGVMGGWAAVSRLFPAMWLFGPACKGILGLFKRKVHRPLLVLAAGFLACLAVVQGGTTLAVGPNTVVGHFQNMMDHNSSEQLSSRRIGLALAIPYRGELLPTNIEPERKKLIESQKPIRFGLAIGIMALLGWGLRKADDDEAFAYGFIPFFLLTTASYYYYVARVTLIIAHASDLSKRRNQVGAIILLAAECFCNWAEIRHPAHRVYLIGHLAWMLAFYAVVMTGFWLWESRRNTTKAQATGLLSTD